MPTSLNREAEAQHLLQNDSEDGYEMSSMNGEPSKMGKDSLPGSPSRKQSEDGGDGVSQEERLIVGIQEMGTVSTDPIYVAKARVLNAAVCLPLPHENQFLFNSSLDSRDRHGLVPMATLRCRWLRVGKR